MTLGENLRALRNKAGLTLGAVSGRLGISLTYLSDMERGLRRVSPAWLQEFANLYHVDPEALRALVPVCTECKRPL